MSDDPSRETPAPGQFLVRPDGTVVGDDGASGALAAALPYTGRLARRTGELVDAGDLRVMEACGTERLVVAVTWTPAGEGTYRAVVVPLAGRTVPSFTVVGAVDTSAAVAHCVARLARVEGVRWSSVVTADARVIGLAGEQRDLDRLAEAGNRMLAILRSLEDQHATGFVRLRFEEGTLVGASLGRHALVASVGEADDDALVAMVDEVRAILADQDLSTVTSLGEPVDEPMVQPPTELPPPPPPLVGARFGGAPTAPRTRPRRRFGSR